jgi:hypothetical protein
MSARIKQKATNSSVFDHKLVQVERDTHSNEKLAEALIAYGA